MGDAAEYPLQTLAEVLERLVGRRLQAAVFHVQPQALHRIEMRAVRRQEEKAQALLFPLPALFAHLPAPVDAGVVDNDRRGASGGQQRLHPGDEVVAADALLGQQGPLMPVPAHKAEGAGPLRVRMRGQAERLALLLPSVGQARAQAEAALVAVVNVAPARLFQAAQLAQSPLVARHRLGRRTLWRAVAGSAEGVAAAFEGALDGVPADAAPLFASPPAERP